MSIVKGVRTAFLACILAVVLAACSEEKETSKPEKEEPKTEDVKKEPEKTEEEEEPVEEEPEPADEQPKDEEQDGLDQDGLDQIGAYMSDFPNALMPIQQGMQAFSEGNFELADNTALMQDSGWKERQSASLQQIQDGINLVREMEVPENPAIIKAHDLLLLAMDEYEKVVKLYPEAIDSVDLNKLNQCTTHLNKGTEYLTQYNDAILEFMKTL